MLFSLIYNNITFAKKTPTTPDSHPNPPSPTSHFSPSFAKASKKNLFALFDVKKTDSYPPQQIPFVNSLFTNLNKKDSHQKATVSVEVIGFEPMTPCL